MKKNENMELKRICDIIKSKKILIAFLLIMFTLLGYIYSYYHVVPQYQSTTTLLLIPNSASESKEVANLELLMNSELITTYSNIAKNAKVLKQTIHNLGLDMTEKQLLNAMQVDVIEDTYVIKITVSHTDAQKAMQITKELSKVFLNEIEQIYHLDNIGVVDEAEIAKYPYNVNHIKDLILFFGLGIMVSLVCVGLFYIFDNTLKKEEDIESYMQIKSLGNIPIYQDKKKEIVNTNTAKSYITECMNTIRTNILYMNSAKEAKTVLVTSCTPREGKSWVSANLATSFAKINKKVLLVDADMRKGRAHKIFKVDNTQGLSNYLHDITGKAEEDISLMKKYIQETDIANLHILTNGMVPPNPSELIDSSNMKELIAMLKSVYDIIIVDAPPCKLVTDSILLSTILDSTILVVNAEKTKIKDLKEVIKSIKAVGGEIIGAILNKKKVAKKVYSGNYYYGHGEQKEIEEIKEKVSVEKVVEQAMVKLEEAKRNSSFEEKESKRTESLEEPNKKEEKQEKEERQEKENSIEWIKKQNTYVEEMLKTIAEVKEQWKNDKRQKESEKENNDNKIKEFISMKLEELKEENQKINYNEQFSQIEKQLEEVKQRHVTTEQMKDIVRQEICNTNYAEEQEKARKEQIQNMIQQEVSQIDYTQDIEKIYHQIEKIKNNIDQTMEEIVNHKKEVSMDMLKTREDNEQHMKNLINETITQLQQEIQQTLANEMVKMDYTEQMTQMSDMLTNLKDSYLELSNRMRNKETDNEDTNHENVIDMTTYRKQKNKKRVYSIEEDIPYEELEQTATYIIPIQTKKNTDLLEDGYQSTMR